ncbi:MAG: DUF1553 domain-containing protein [Bryobacteraceae bacterium]
MSWREIALMLAAAATGWAAPPEGVSILEKRCLGCHNGNVKKSGFDLSSRATLVRGGDRGPAVVPGNAKDSFLYRVITRAAEPHMPFKGARMPDAEIAAVAAWIDHGAQFEQSLKPAAAAAPAPADQHWAFQLPARPALPAVKNQGWVRNPIDAFVAAAHDRNNLTPVGEADRGLLLRRVYLDLIGLPPSREELEKFLADVSPNSYEKVVDRLLTDPRYGERWGRHWMDVWRYSDWYGWRKAADVRNSHRFVWRWRDWIVGSLNQDRGYDRMITEMIAGDEIRPADPETVRATGYLARNFNKYDREGWMQDAVDHTAMGMLGLTLKCARCHDHKYDPISQQEYYQFRAFFEPYEVRVDRVPGQTDVEKDGLARIFDAELDRKTFLLVRGNVQEPDKDHPLSPGVPHALGGKLGDIKSVPLPVDAYYPDHRPVVQRDLITDAKADIERAEAELRKAKEAYAKSEREASGLEPKATLEKLRDPSDRMIVAGKALAAAKAQLPSLEARIAADNAKFSDPPDIKYEEFADKARKLEREAGILKADENVYRGQMEFQAAIKARKPGNAADEKKVGEAQKKLAAAQTALTQAGEGYHSVGKIYPDRSTGRRTALATWIANRGNPLTARVAINHMWLRHFGKGLVPTVFDFGKNGKPASHPELLDWLATEFMENGWSMKSIHRLMVTSNTYRMLSTGGATNANAGKDPENRYLWRMNPRRMEAEVVRDSVLFVAGHLDQTMGGPEIEDPQGLKTNRRSIYFAHSPDVQVEFFKIFDSASTSECYERTESVVPQQALALANSQISRDQSRAMARRLNETLGTGAPPRTFVSSAFESILGRGPTPKELAAGEQFLRSQPDLYRETSRLSVLGKPDASEKPVTVADAGLRAKENFIHVLFNHNDFVTIR